MSYQKFCFLIEGAIMYFEIILESPVLGDKEGTLRYRSKLIRFTKRDPESENT